MGWRPSAPTAFSCSVPLQDSLCTFFSVSTLSFNSVNAYTALCFVSSLIQAKLSPASVNKILAGTSFFLKFAGLPALSSFFPVKQVLRGFRRSSPAIDNRRPLSYELLAKLMLALESVCFSSFETILFRTAFVLAFFGAFRIGELTAPNKASSYFLLFSDISVMEGLVKIFLRRSKMDQSGKGRWITLYRAPFQSIFQFLGLPNIFLSDPLFQMSCLLVLRNVTFLAFISPHILSG